MVKYTFIGFILLNLILCTIAMISGQDIITYNCQICDKETTEPVIVQIDAGHKVYIENKKEYVDVWEYTLCQKCYDKLMPILFKELKRMRKESNAQENNQ